MLWMLGVVAILVDIVSRFAGPGIIPTTKKTLNYHGRNDLMNEMSTSSPSVVDLSVMNIVEQNSENVVIEILEAPPGSLTTANPIGDASYKDNSPAGGGEDTDNNNLHATDTTENGMLGRDKTTDKNDSTDHKDSRSRNETPSLESKTRVSNNLRTRDPSMDANPAFQDYIKRKNMERIKKFRDIDNNESAANGDNDSTDVDPDTDAATRRTYTKNYNNNDYVGGNASDAISTEQSDKRDKSMSRRTGQPSGSGSTTDSVTVTVNDDDSTEIHVRNEIEINTTDLSRTNNYRDDTVDIIQKLTIPGPEQRKKSPKQLNQ